MTQALALQAIEQCVLGQIGAIRKVTEGSVALDAYDGIADVTLAERVRVKARVEVIPVSTVRTGIVAPENAGTHVHSMKVTIRLALSTESEVQASARLATRQSALELAETVRNAVCLPPNVRLTQDGSATGIVSGCVQRCAAFEVKREDWAKRLFVLEARATVLVKTSPATS